MVIQLFMGNDVTDAKAMPGPARWYDADRYLFAIVWHRLRMMSRAKLVDAATGIESSVPTDSELPVRYPWLTDPLLEKPSMGREVFLEVESQNARGICRPNPGVFERFFEALELLKATAGRVPVAFVVIPDEFQVEDSLWQEVVRRSDQPLDRDQAQRKIVGWLKSRGWPVLDLLPLLRAVEPLKDGRRHLYLLQDTHFNARGNEMTGRALARMVDSLLHDTTRSAFP